MTPKIIAASDGHWWGCRRNGKTKLAAALALYFLIGDQEPAPLVVCSAPSDERADLVFGAAKTMADLSPTLRQVTERWEREILVPSVPGAKLKRVAAASGTNDGQNIHVVICDEFHEWQGTKGEAMWNVLTNGTGARRQPMVLQITTAGYDLEGTICGRQDTYAKRVAKGEIDDPSYYFRWHQATVGLRRSTARDDVAGCHRRGHAVSRPRGRGVGAEEHGGIQGAFPSGSTRCPRR